MATVKNIATGKVVQFNNDRFGSLPLKSVYSCKKGLSARVLKSFKLNNFNGVLQFETNISEKEIERDSKWINDICSSATGNDLVQEIRSYNEVNKDIISLVLLDPILPDPHAIIDFFPNK